MNIFVLDSHPDKCAKFHCDKHVVKMILESAQMLCTAARFHGLDDIFYKSTHINHPCSIWVRESRGNAKWLVKLVSALNKEWQIRYEHEHNHLSYQKLLDYGIDKILDSIPEGGITPFAQCMPEEYRKESAIEAYREYYIKDKSEIATWKFGEPKWWTEMSENITALNLHLNLSAEEYDNSFDSNHLFSHPYIIPYLESVTGIKDLVDVDIQEVKEILDTIGIETIVFCLDSKECSETSYRYSEYYDGKEQYLSHDWQADYEYNEYHKLQDNPYHLITSWETEDGPVSLLGRLKN